MLLLKVCIGSSCHLKGAYNVLQTFQQMVEEYALHDAVEIQAQFCMRKCRDGVSVSVGDALCSVAPENARAFFQTAVLPALGAAQTHAR